MLKRVVQVLAVVTIALTMLGANSGSGTRLDEIGHKLVCQCGCGQILVECSSPLTCPSSVPMIKELKTQIAAGDTEAVILQNFITKYGPVVLAAPIRGGFDDIAWIVPYAVFFLGTIGVALLILYWRRRNLELHPALNEPPPPPDDKIRARIRRDTDFD